MKAKVARTEPDEGATRTARRAPRDETNNRLFFRLFQCANLYETAALRELNITGVQGATLGALSRDVENGMSFSDLYAYLSVSRQNLDAVLKRLERLGYVERCEGTHDRRTRIVRLTLAGAQAWKAQQNLNFEFYRQATAGVSVAEAIACADTLAKIGRALKAARLKLTDE